MDGQLEVYALVDSTARYRYLARDSDEALAAPVAANIAGGLLYGLPPQLCLA